MFRNAPKFWRKKGIIAHLLLPFSVFYFFYRRMLESKTKAQNFSVPIITIGNATVGGGGKTPLVIFLGKALSVRNNAKVMVVSRGYGGELHGPLLVDSSKHTYKHIGDEPLLIAQHLPCIVSKNRADGISFAIKQNATIILTDDGLQDYSVKASCGILAIDGGYGEGNGIILPSGPLRDRLDKVLERTHITIITGEDKNQLQKKLPNSVSCFHAKIMPISGVNLLKKYLAFAGIARPEKFFETLKEHSIQVSKMVAYADHYPYSEDDMKSLLKQAKKLGVSLITTEKDLVRIPENYRAEITVLKMNIEISDSENLLKCVDSLCAK